MGKKIRVTESQLRQVVKSRMLQEYGRKGAWKPEWNKEDQILAMFNSMYGLETLGMSKQDVAEQIIGTSLASLNQQTSNFDYLRTGAGLDRPHPLQTEVYEEFKNTGLNDFKKIAMDIVKERIENPEEAVVNRKIGKEIGGKRDETEKGREEALRKLGKDPSKMKLISSKPKEVEKSEYRPSSKGDVKDYLTSLWNQIKGAKSPEDIQQLADDVLFIRDYIEDEWIDDEDNRMIAETQNLFDQVREAIPHIGRIREIMIL